MNEQKVIALGFFDGVHRGHAALLRRTVQRARELGVRSAAFTFDRSPREFVTGVPVPLLTDVEERVDLIRSLYGVSEVIVAPFDRDMMTMSWRDFLDGLLVGEHHAVHLVAGHDYRFGHRNEGTPALLREYCASHGLGCDIVEKVTLHGVTVSSTYIRTLVESGDVSRAAEYLGHPYALRGTVAHGQCIGTRRLFPTANLLPDGAHILPAHGVYATRVRLDDGSVYPGVTNVGVRPTVSEDGRVTVETHLVGFSGDLYGRAVRVEFLAWLRPEQRYPSTEALHAQIERDIAAASALHERAD